MEAGLSLGLATRPEFGGCIPRTPTMALFGHDPRMPTSAHETPLDLLRLDPALPDWVQRELLGDDSPTFHHARLYDPNVRPHTYQSDGMVLFCDARDRPERGTVFETQLGRDPEKLASWKLYIGHVEREFNIKASLVIFTANKAVADWYRKLIARDTVRGARLHPRIFPPEDVPLLVDEVEAANHPARALLSAICHDKDRKIDAMFPALLAALDALDPAMKIFYDSEVIGRLPAVAQTRWEAFLMTTTSGRRYRVERYNEIDAEAEARGEARGKAWSVLGVLEARGMHVPDETRAEILACSDADRLDLWLRRAVTAVTAEDVTRS